MSWYVAGVQGGSAVLTPDARNERQIERASFQGAAAGGLGSACAASVGVWAPPARSGADAVEAMDSFVHHSHAGVAMPSMSSLSAQQHRLLHMPGAVLRGMAEAAWASGRSEEEIWIEAAREWLRRNAREDEPPPSAPAAAAPPHPRFTRAWAAIDSLLGDLRATPRAAPLAPQT